MSHDAAELREALKLIAYYSEVPVKPTGNPRSAKTPGSATSTSKMPTMTPRCVPRCQGDILAEPEGHAAVHRAAAQPASEPAKLVVLSYSSQHSLVLSAKDARLSPEQKLGDDRARRAVQRAQTVLEGSSCHLSCNVRASESPPSPGCPRTVRRESADGRPRRKVLRPLTSGWLKIRSTQPSDAGLYQCVASGEG